MGYTLYWRRLPRLDAASFKAASDDVKILCAEIEKMGVLLAGPKGQGPIQSGPDRIAFNGLSQCGHPHRKLDHAYPSDDAEGIELILNPVVGSHFAGALIKGRSCGGTCSAEPFIIDRLYDPAEWEEKNSAGMYRQHCTTEYKPYDLAVACALIRIKHHLDEEICVTTDDDEIPHLRDAVALCRRTFERSSAFALEPEPALAVEHP